LKDNGVSERRRRRRWWWWWRRRWWWQQGAQSILVQELPWLKYQPVSRGVAPKPVSSWTLPFPIPVLVLLYSSSVFSVFSA